MAMIQLELFNMVTLNIAKPLKVAMNDDMKACGQSREQIVGCMNDLADRNGVCLVHGNGARLTLDTLEKWLNVSDLTRIIPLKALPIFCAAVGRYASVNVLTKSMGLRVIDAREQKLLAWAEAKMEVQKKSRQIRKLEAEL